MQCITVSSVFIAELNQSSLLKNRLENPRDSPTNSILKRMQYICILLKFLRSYEVTTNNT